MQQQTVQEARIATGVVGWLDLATDDPAATAAFWAPVLGLDVRVLVDGIGSGLYDALLVDGDVTVAGVTSALPSGQGPTWTPYLTSHDAGATAAEAVEAGGDVELAPWRVDDAGRIARLTGPGGTPLALWEPMGLPGPGWEQAGRVTASLVVDDPALAGTFLDATVGWELVPEPGVRDGWVAQVSGRPVAAVRRPDPRRSRPERVVGWHVRVAVDDLPAALAAATRRGGRVVAASRPSTAFTVVQPGGSHCELVQRAGADQR